MKQILVVLSFFTLISISYGQDKIIKLTGDTITCKVKEITNDNIKYCYEGEDLLNNISKNTVRLISFNSGRIQKFNERIIINSEEDWEKVQITTLESDIEGLFKGNVMMAKASSGWSTTNQGKVQLKAMDRLKMQAATKGYHIVLLITTTGKGGHAGVSGGTKSSVTGIGYSYDVIAKKSSSSLPVKKSYSSLPVYNVGDKVQYIGGFKKIEGIISKIKGDYYTIEYSNKKGVKETIKTTDIWLKKI